MKEEQQPLPLWKRIGIGLFFPFCAALALLYARYGTHGNLCLFHNLTGLYCPGCGTGRAVSGFLRGRSLRWVRVVFPFLGFRPVYVSQRTLKILIGIILGFWILRNLPMFAFLAPPVLPH